MLQQEIGMLINAELWIAVLNAIVAILDLTRVLLGW